MVSMRIGIFGGTFDPPHLGHLILASEALDQLKLDRLLWVLTPTPPHKLSRPISPVEDRLELVLAAIQDNDLFELSRVDLDRPGPHYAADTVGLLQKHFAGCELIYLLGGDSLHDLPLWYQPKTLVKRVTGLGVMRRPGSSFDLNSLARHLPGIEQKVHFIDTPLLEISSSFIRQRIAASGTFRYFLPEKVFDIIQEKNLYRPVDCCK